MLTVDVEGIDIPEVDALHGFSRGGRAILKLKFNQFSLYFLKTFKVRFAADHFLFKELQ